MNYGEVKKELKNEFEGLLKSLGYKSKNGPQGCEFSRVEGQQLLRIGYGVSNFGNEFYTSCYSKISILPIQRIQEAIFQESGVYDTLTNSISHFKNEINYSYRIHSMENIKAWINLVQDFLDQSAFPFFEKFNTIEALDILVNSNPKEKVIYCDDLYWRVMNSLISAKLNHNTKYFELRDFFKTEVEKTYKDHFNYEKCMKTIEFLDNHSQEELLKLAETA